MCFVVLGTSGSRTPDDDLEPSHFNAPRRISSPRSSNENLADDDKDKSTRDSSNSFISRSSSSYSFAPSFSSDFPDTDSLLPDLSDSVRSGKLNSSGGVGISDKETRMFNVQSEFRNRSSSGNTGEQPRPRTLGLIKRNSDLPGRVRHVDDYNKGFYPIGMKQSASDTNLNKDPYAIEEEISLRAISEIASSSSNTVTSSKSDELENEDLKVGDDHTSLLSESVTVIDIDSKEAPAPDGGGDSSVVVPIEDTISPVQSPTKEKTKYKELASSPTSSKNPFQSPSIETEDVDVSLTTSVEEAPSAPEIPVEAGSRELIIPVMTALQERRSSTPNCSTADESTETQSPDRAESPVNVTPDKKEIGVVDEKKSETKAKPRSAYTSRVSVKDRLQQYERNRSGSVDSNRKMSSELFNPNSVASRKQMFEQRERGLYKRVSDMTGRKPRSDSGSGSGSASGSPKLSRKRLNDIDDGNSATPTGSQENSKLEKGRSVESDKQDEPRRRNRKDKSENIDRPRSLILDRLDRQRGGELDSLKLDLHDGATLSPREIDIPLDSMGAEDKLRSERPRRSPNTSPRSSRTNVRSSFADDSKEEDREPQFV